MSSASPILGRRTVAAGFCKEDNAIIIRQVQALLSYLGYNPGIVDGVNGPLTAAAVRAFQAAEGLTVDGIPGVMTQAALKDSVANDRFAQDQSEAASGQSPDSGAIPAAPGFWADIRYFSREVEFLCGCNGRYCNGFPSEPEEKLVRLAERVREHFGKPIEVSSGVRCAIHNAKVGGVANSRHLRGKAMDFRVSGYAAEAVLAFVRSQPETRYAYAINHNFIHMDVE